jgi:outer membrane beta-barrel protein
MTKLILLKSLRATIFFVTIASMGASIGTSLAYADEANKKVEVDKLKKKYWSQQAGNEVVQDRLYTKAGKFEIGTYGGLFNTDPFLEIVTAGLSVGYHFDELFSLHLLGWKSWSRGSSALNTLETTSTKSTANTNHQRGLLGAEFRASIVYGKLSLLGKMILYYDFYVNLGGGRLDSESGAIYAPFMGVGQQIYLSERISLKLDFKELWFKEDVLEKSTGSNKGKVATTRTNWSNTVYLGLAFLL